MTTEDFETILRNSSWSGLSTSEKEAIRDIAPDEAAFRTAKQILLMAAHERAEVPVMTSKMRYMPPAQPQRKNTIPLWYAAAALLVLVSVGAWWYAQRTDNGVPPVAVKQTPVPTAKAPVDSAPALQTTLAATAPANEKKKAIRQTPPKNKDGEQLVIPPQNIPNGDATVFLASNEPVLLDLVVEMY